jgi:hypothetical protein
MIIIIIDHLLNMLNILDENIKCIYVIVNYNYHELIK